jgi:hypothetical protein
MSELVAVLWLNPDRETHPQARIFQCLCAANTPPIPLSFRYKDIEASKIGFSSTVVRNEEDFYRFLTDSTRNSPLIVPIKVLEDMFGWEEFLFSYYINHVNQQ